MEDPDVVPKLLKLMEDTFGTFFKMYYEGDPGMIPKSAFPCVIVEKLTASTELGPTGFDVLESQVSIRVLYDKADDANAGENTETTEKKLRQKIEGRDPVTRTFKEDTVMHALRTNITLGQVMISSTASWTYDIVPRSETLATSEAEIQIVTRENVPVSLRT